MASDLRKRAEEWVRAEYLNFEGDPYLDSLHQLLQAVRDEALAEAIEVAKTQAPEPQLDDYRRGQRRGVLDCVEILRALKSGKR